MTVCIYVYAGQQQNLPARNFRNVNTGGLTTDVTKFVTDTVDGATLSLDKNDRQTFFFENSTVSTLSLPSKNDILAVFPVKQNGALSSFGGIYNHQAATDIVVTPPTGVSLVNGAATLAISFETVVALDSCTRMGI